MSILSKSKPPAEVASSVEALIEERATLLASLAELERRDTADRETAMLAGIGIGYTEAGTPEGAAAVARGIYLSEESKQLTESRYAADARRRAREPELRAGRDKVRHLDSRIRHALEARLALAAEPQQRAVEDALRAAFDALHVLAARRLELSEAHGITLSATDYETAVDAGLRACCSAVGLAAPESMTSRQGRAAMAEMAAAAKKRDRHIADLEEQILRPPALIEALTRQGDIAAQKARELEGERRQEEAIRERLTQLPKAEQDRRRKLRQEIKETEGSK